MAKTSVKHIKIGKDQSTILIVTVAATAITIFSLFALRAMVVKGLYNHRALNAKQDVVQQLKANIEAANKLVTQYSVFADANPNMLGGNKDGSGGLDGPNPRITLDALPSKYDIPALASSIEKLLLGRNVTINAITLKDDPTGNSDKPKSDPTVTKISYSYQGQTNYSTAQQALGDFERSIRSFDVTKLDVSGSDNALRIQVEGITNFQAARSVDIDTYKEIE